MKSPLKEPTWRLPKMPLLCTDDLANGVVYSVLGNAVHPVALAVVVREILGRSSRPTILIEHPGEPLDPCCLVNKHASLTASSLSAWEKRRWTPTKTRSSPYNSSNEAALSPSLSSTSTSSSSARAHCAHAPTQNEKEHTKCSRPDI